MTDKTPLALLPGLLCDAALWQPQVDGLSDIADCWVADFTSQESIAAMAESVLAAMPERFALAGLSMGGYVALEIMATAPERVTRLALLDTRPQPDSEEQRSRRRGHDLQGHVAAHGKTGQRKLRRRGLKDPMRHCCHRVVGSGIGDRHRAVRREFFDLMTPQRRVAKQSGNQDKRRIHAHGCDKLAARLEFDNAAYHFRLAYYRKKEPLT